MVKLKQVVMPLIELIQENITTNKLPLRYKGYAEMNPFLLSSPMITVTLIMPLEATTV